MNILKNTRKLLGIITFIVFTTPTTFASQLLITQQQDPTSIPRYLTNELIPGANQSSGALVHDYPIQVPPGRNGLQPDLKLTYNNQASEEGAIFGSGWSINIPSIERINRKGSNQLYSQNYFYSSLSGELASTSVSTWGAKIDNGDFLTYTFASSTWTVVDKKGTIYKFGITAGSRQDDPSDSTRINKWMLEEVRDTNDNYIKYVYYKDAGQIYPSQIIYTGNGTTDGIFEVGFQRQSRNDAATSSKPQFNIISNYRVSEIDTKINGTLAHKYVLTYGSGANSARSTLASITESGIDDSSTTTTLPATTFTYQGQTVGWTSNSGFGSPSAFTAGTANEQATQIADVNGDGLLDVLFSGYEWVGGVFTPTSHVWSNNGNSWTLSSWTIPELFVDASYNDIGTRVADVNGDGLADILSTKYVYNGSSWDTVNKVYINNGSGWTYDNSWSLPIPLMAWTGSATEYGVRIFDVNGDGLPDIVHAPWTGSTAVYLNTGTGWSLNTNWVMPARLMQSTTAQQATEIADVNGDGLTDVLFAGPEWDGGCGCFIATSHVWLNNGNGWTLDTSWSVPEQFRSGSYTDLGVRLGDVNGDGLVDILFSGLEWDGGTNSYVWHNRVRINTGHGWVYDSSWSIPVQFIKCAGVCFSDNGVRLADVNGDGITDIMYAPWNVTPTTYLGNSHKIDSLTQITNPKGGMSTITYKSSAQYMSSGTPLNPSLPLVLETVSQVANSDGLGNTSNTQYKYEGGKMYFNGPFDRRFAGYSKVTATDNMGDNTINYYHQGDTTNSSQGEYSDHVSKVGKIYRTEKTDSSGNMYSKTINKWDKYDLGNGRNFVKQNQQLTLTYDGDSSHKDKAETYTYDNSNGNITQKIQLGQVTGADDGTYTDTGTDDFTTAYTYASNTGANILGIPDDVVVTDHGATKVKEDRYYYDTQSLGSVTKGNETKHEQWKSGSTYINTQKTYDGTYGLVTQSSDARGKNTGYGYDSYNVYPATVTDPLSHITSYTYDYSSGQVKQKTDPNSRVFQSVYDGMDRLIAEKQPDQTTPSTLITKTAYVYTDTSGAVSVHKTDNLDASAAAETYTYFDGLGRKIQERKEAESPNYEVRDYAYNNLGLLQKESLPYFSSGSSKTSPIITASLYTTYTYDPVQRILTSTNAAGTTSNTYSDWETTVTDPRSKTRDLYKDAYGNLVQVDEHNGGNTYSTYYTYNYLGNLVSITDASGNVRNFTYDGLGKNLAAQDLHASGDTSYGTWTYTYDNAGNLTQKVDPKSQTINYTHDDINRPLTEDYTGASGTEVSYTYDSGTNGIGHLTGITTANITQTNTYNPIGLVASESKVVNGATYPTSHTYDYQGHQVTITNPDSSQVKYVYNSAGLLDQVQRKESTDVDFIDVVSNFDYSPTEKSTNVAYANGMNTENTYDATNLYRLINKTSAFSAPPFNINPAITLTGTYLINLYAGGVWTEPGYSATDTEDGNLTSSVTVTGSVSTSTPGIYHLVYNVVDSQSAPAEGKVRTVVVHSATTTNPVITLTGANLINKNVGDTWTEPGYSASDTVDGNITSSVIVAGSVSTSTPGVYQLVYNATNSQGVPAVGKIRTVVVHAAATGAVKVLVVGGGAGASYGGGGAGGYQFNTSFSVAAQTYSVTVGVGGSGATKPTNGSNGANSTFSTIIAYGGGYGGGGNDGGTGASGGGGTQNAWGAGAGMQGHNGGGGINYSAGGGGGSNGNGGTAAQWSGGGGGAGTSNSITGSALTYSAGGSGGSYGSNGAGSNGSANTGNGGKGADQYGGSGGSGGSGVVIISYATNGSDGVSASSTGGTITTSGSQRIHRFTANGTWAMVPAPSSNTNPVITLTGASLINLFVNSTWVEPGYAATDTENGNLTASTTVTGSVNTAVAGTYQLIYSVVDTQGAPAERKIRTVVVHSATTTNPVITLTGANLINLSVSDTWSELGYSATDAEDGNLTASTTVTGSVNTAAAGTYQLVYNVTNSQGTPAEGKIRTVVVHAGVDYLQNINYTYDANGNISQILDSSSNNAAKTVVYTYDDLNRLLTASTTAVTSGQTPYAENYAYDAIGNITSKTGQGSYTYAGNTGSSYANPHAATTIASSTLTYDNNGNMLASGSAYTNTWDYSNRIIQTLAGSSTLTYTYDPAGQRLTYAVGTSTTTIYPSMYYNTDGTAITKHFFANGMEIATVTGTGASSTPHYVATDHLLGSSITTSASSTREEMVDYFPFGSMRLNEKSGTYTDQRKYAGSEYDTESGLNYMNARYYDGGRGQFLSEDPSFLALGDEQQTKSMTGMRIKDVLADPQSLNSYSYARNNPMKNTDPTGRWFGEVMTGRQSWSSFGGEINQAAYQLSQSSSAWNFGMNHPVAGGILTAGASIPAVLAGESAAAAFWMATYPGVGASFATQQAIAGTVYSGLTISNTLGIPELVGAFSKGDRKNPSTFYPATLSLTKEVGLSSIGRQVEAVGAMADAMQVGKSITNFAANLSSTNSLQKSTDSKKTKQ